MSGASIDAYEELRSHVLAGSTLGGHSGLFDVLRGGVAGWLARRSLCGAPAPSAPLSSPCAASSPVSNELSSAVVQVLASIALASRSELSR